jgi:hypothetical protein
VDCTQAKGFALAHWLANGADGGRLFVHCLDRGGKVRGNAAGDVLASLTTMQWNAPSKSWTGGAAIADAWLNRRITVRLADVVAFAQIGVVGCACTGCEASPALLCGTWPRRSACASSGRRSRWTSRRSYPAPCTWWTSR